MASRTGQKAVDFTAGTAPKNGRYSTKKRRRQHQKKRQVRQIFTAAAAPNGDLSFFGNTFFTEILEQIFAILANYQNFGADLCYFSKFTNFLVQFISHFSQESL